MFDSIRDAWNNWGFEIILVLSILTILVLAVFRLGKDGTYTDYMKRRPPSFGHEREYAPYGLQSNPTSRRGPPTESKGERECRRVMESLFVKPFSKSRPDFLRNPVTSGDDQGIIRGEAPHGPAERGNNLEIDCFNAELRLGVEYNGIQHYKYKPFFHKNFEAFRNQQYRDEMKRSLCKENGIKLIEVPYTVKHEDIAVFIAKALDQLGYGREEVV